MGINMGTLTGLQPHIQQTMMHCVFLYLTWTTFDICISCCVFKVFRFCIFVIRVTASDFRFQLYILHAVHEHTTTRTFRHRVQINCLGDPKFLWTLMFLKLQCWQMCPVIYGQTNNTQIQHTRAKTVPLSGVNHTQHPAAPVHFLTSIIIQSRTSGGRLLS